MSRRLADTSRGARAARLRGRDRTSRRACTELVDWWSRATATAAASSPSSARWRGAVMQVPFASPASTAARPRPLAAVIASGWVSQGPRVQAFEAAFAARVGAAEAVATTNCTTALQLALYASGVGPGDEVIVPVAVVHRHRQRGLAVRRDAGVRRHRPAHLQPRPGRRRARRSRARTKAIMPVHQIGLPADMDAFLALGRAPRPRDRRGRRVRRSARPTRAARSARSGPLACFSLHPRKVITTGEGGMITTNDPELADRLRKLRQHAMDLSDLARHNADGHRLRELSRARLEHAA